MVEFKITDLSKKMSISEIQNLTLSFFSTPMKIPKESAKFMTLEEFIVEEGNEE